MARRLVLGGFLLLAAIGSMASCGAPDLEYEGTGATGGESAGGSSTGGGGTGGARGGTGGRTGGSGGDAGDGGAGGPDHCSNGEVDEAAGETDEDCGGPCPRCADGRACEGPSDCLSGVCTDAVCMEPTCGDEVQNGEETDVDCGGTDPSCRRCDVQEGCVEDADCVTSRCDGGRCGLVCEENLADCNGDLEDLCETNLLTTVEHCGACDQPCELPHATAACSEGACVIAVDDETEAQLCATGYADCNASGEDGCEADLRTDVDNCGSCGNRCTDANGTVSCVAGECVSACAPGFEDCGGDYRCETDITQSVSHCGGCGIVCPSSQGSPWCSGSECGYTVCPAGTGDCDGDGECETDVTASAAHCGACGNACAPPNGTGVCADSVCAIGACDASYGDCDGEYENGCEQSLTSLDHCGVCDVACARDHASASCAEGTCTLGTCAANWGNCDANDANGCETDLRVTASHCGACGDRCTIAHATAACVESACAIATCSSGYGDCNGFVVDGCEAQFTTDEANCGACGVVCQQTHASANECTSGVCVPTCISPYAVCGTPPNLGCTTNTDTNASHCGACSYACSAINMVSCGSGSCEGCVSPYGDCTSSPGCETNLNTSVSHCGVCGNVCSDAHGTVSCASGACDSACATNYGDCTGDYRCETDLRVTTAHCGACGNACADPNGTVSCANSACDSACDSGYYDCGGDYRCETARSVSNCGGCGVTCTDPNGTVSCTSAGACDSACDSGYYDCGGDYRCETARSVSNCGGCGVTCSDPNGTVSCTSAGACASTCDAAYLNCSGDYRCETPRSLTDCTGCGQSCGSTNASPSCSLVTGSYRCVMNCAEGYGNCDGNDANGCERSLLADANNCGACGNVCGSAAPFCVEGSCRSYLDIAVVNATTVGTGTNSVSRTHTLATGSGNYRLLVVGVAGKGNSVAEATPNAITYGGVAMTLARGQWSGNQSWAGIYYLLDASLGAAGIKTLSITNTGAMSTIANIVELKGVSQTTPIQASSGANFGNCSSSDPAGGIGITGIGALTYDLVAAFGSGTGSASNGQTETVDATSSDLHAIGGYRGPYSSTGSYTLGWDISVCNNTAQGIVAFNRATGS